MGTLVSIRVEGEEPRWQGHLVDCWDKSQLDDVLNNEDIFVKFKGPVSVAPVWINKRFIKSVLPLDEVSE